MDPMIKWPGGKSREIKIIEQYIPAFERYFEPFFGGGAVGFDLEPDTALVNDIDTKLINFYIDVQTNNQKFIDELNTIVFDWRLIEDLAPLLINDYQAIFPDTVEEIAKIDGKIKVNQLLDHFESDITKIISELQRVEPTEFNQFFQNSIKSKTQRVIKLQIKHETVFDDDLIFNHLMTAIKAAYYTHIRDIFNQNSTSAVFYFIREFCYGSMFRFNSKGEFNIPYGGINYNSKDIEAKITYLQSNEVTSVLANFNFHNTDFAKFFSQFELTSSDFIFLDPPYDTDFKNYGKNPFTKDDQRRLANYLATCPAKWLLVIKKSDLIWKLYNELDEPSNNVSILAYDKKYTYNVRGRNDRDVSHLLITNYDAEMVKSEGQTELTDYF